MTVPPARPAAASARFTEPRSVRVRSITDAIERQRKHWRSSVRSGARFPQDAGVIRGYASDAGDVVDTLGGLNILRSIIFSLCRATCKSALFRLGEIGFPQIASQTCGTSALCEATCKLIVFEVPRTSTQDRQRVARELTLRRDPSSPSQRAYKRRRNSSRLTRAVFRMFPKVPGLIGRLPWTGTGIASGISGCRSTW